MDSRKAASKVMKLLRLAEDQAGTPEGESAAAKAYALMREHAIEVSLSGEEEEENVKHGHEVGRSNWKRSLMSIIGKHCSVYVLTSIGTRFMQLYGKPSNIEVCLYLFDICERQIEAECKEYMKWTDTGGKSQSNSFKMSAVYGLSTKLDKMRREAEGTDQTGTSLVVSDYRRAEEFAKGMVNVRNGPKSEWSYNHSGYNAGLKVRISDGIAGERGPKMLGGSQT